jgi:thiol-disulfide isomerase/thioredoxin
LLATALLAGTVVAQAADHPEARPFVETANASADLDSTLAANDRKIIVVMGANWCHDSRALAGWFATPRFAAMLRDRYRIIYVDSGSPQTGKGRNLDIASRFGVKKVKSTPLVFVLSPDGKLLNSRKDAVSWRNAASRSEDEIYRYFAGFGAAQK